MSTPVGVQLYSVRELAAKDLHSVLKSIKQMGYEGVEFAGFHGHTAPAIKAMLDDAGLKCCGTHTQLDQLLGDNFEKTVAFHKVIGATMAIVPGMGEERRATVAALADTAKLFNELAEKLKPHGMRTGYHAHGGDFAKVNGGRSQWEILFASVCDDVVMQMDTGNCVQGGGDPVALLRQFASKAYTVHLKEFGGPHSAVVGEGMVDWKGVLEACKGAPVEWYVVEHEVRGVDALRAIERFREGLRGFGV